VRITDVSGDLKDPDYTDDPQMRTAELFRFCLGRKFQIPGFDRYGFVELQVSDDPAVRRKFGLNSVWIEPRFLDLVAKTRRTVTRPTSGFGWKEDVRKSEAEAKDVANEVQTLGGKRSKGLEGRNRNCNSKSTIRCIF
jgi:hypothetical protein